MVFILPGAGRFTKRLFLAGDQERIAGSSRNEATSLPLLDQELEIRANVFWECNMGA